MSGAKPWVFWTASFVWDMVIVAVAAVLVVILFVIFDVPGREVCY